MANDDKTLPASPTGSVTITPVLKRNSKAPVYFSPVVDIRISDRDVRLLSFLIPAADADEIIADGDRYVLPLASQCELVLPPDTVEAMIEGLQLQLQALRRARGELPEQNAAEA